MMRRIYILLVLAAAHLCNEMRAADPYLQSVELKFNKNELPKTISIRDSLGDVLDGRVLYGEGNNEEVNDEIFNSFWNKDTLLLFKRTGGKISLYIPEHTNAGDYCKNVFLAKEIENSGSRQLIPDNAITINIKIIDDAKLKDQDAKEKASVSSDKEEQEEQEDQEGTKMRLLSKLSIAGLILSLVDLFIIILILIKISRSQSHTASTGSGNDLETLRRDVQKLQSKLTQSSLTESDVKRLIKETVPTVSSPSSVSSETNKKASNHTTNVQKHIQPTRETTETIDTLEYSFETNKFEITDNHQQIFVISRKGNEYTYTLKSEDVCMEIVPLLNAYSKCISVMGNTVSAKGISSITPGTLCPTGDNRTFSVSKSIVINFN